MGEAGRSGQNREFGFESIWLEDGMLYGSEALRPLFETLVGRMWARLATTAEVRQALRRAGTGEVP